MPPTNVEFRMVCADDTGHKCPACDGSTVIVALSTVAAEYMTCQACEHTWSVPRMPASAAFRMSKIVGAPRPARS